MPSGGRRTPPATYRMAWLFLFETSRKRSSHLVLAPRRTSLRFPILASIFRKPASLCSLDQMGTFSLVVQVSHLHNYNRAGKSTSLSIIGGLASSTSGTITYAGGVARPARGTLGLVPQKNVLFPGLTCLQTLKVWQAIKWSSNSERDEDLEQLLRDYDLEKKIHSMADSMSGGQKRKLQLAIGLLGGSKSAYLSLPIKLG